MGTREVCGNRYDKAFSVKTAEGAAHTFDSFECAIEKLAPRCAHRNRRIIGHGVDDDATGKIYCCEHCAHA